MRILPIAILFIVFGFNTLYAQQLKFHNITVSAELLIEFDDWCTANPDTVSSKDINYLYLSQAIRTGERKIVKIWAYWFSEPEFRKFYYDGKLYVMVLHEPIPLPRPDSFYDKYGKGTIYFLSKAPNYNNFIDFLREKANGVE